MSKRRSSHLQELHAKTSEVIRMHLQVSEEQVTTTTNAIISAIRQEFSGEKIYVSKPKYDADAVLHDFTGRNQKEVCKKHNISRSTLFNVIRSRRGKK